MTKQEKVNIANQAIMVITSYGRCFFSMQAEGRTWEANRVSYFTLHNNKLWFVDKYSEKAVYVAYKGKWRHFSEGGTLQSLVEEIGRWIRGKRKDFPMNLLGPWPDWVCGGDLWGYGKDMEKVRTEIGTLVNYDKCY